MTEATLLSGTEIRAESAQHSNLRARDLAAKLNVSEAQLVASQVGFGTTCIAPKPDDIMPLIQGLGEVMALTRNESCVIEKVGIYDNFHSGQHASMILNGDIDLRMFPAQWIHAFAVETETDKGAKRSIQVFDSAGDAVHKIHLRASSDLEQWKHLVESLRLEDQPDTLKVEPRKSVEGPKGDVTKADKLRAEWIKLTDTHQFLRLMSKMKMNRLGAYRMVGEPLARKLNISAVDSVLEAVAGSGVEIMFFVGNYGCIEIHGGPFDTLKPMGPWQNILDPGFNVHLRSDHIAEVWAVTKPTGRGDTVSVEAFDAQGGLIFQIFGRKVEGHDSWPAWKEIIAAQPTSEH